MRFVVGLIAMTIGCATHKATPIACDTLTEAACTSDSRCAFVTSCCGSPAHCSAAGFAAVCPADCSIACSSLNSEAACRDRADCVADFCQPCGCASVFSACRTAGTMKAACATADCSRTICCHATSDCPQEDFEQCNAPGQFAGCGACRDYPTCSHDSDCADGGTNQICDTAQCSCSSGSGLSCVQGCSGNGDCHVGQICTSDHHCHAKSCSSDVDCPQFFQCANDGCARIQCIDDSACPGGACVNQACYPSVGTCSSIPV